MAPRRPNSVTRQSPDSRPPRRVDLKKLERRKIPALLLVAGVLLGNAMFFLSPYPEVRFQSLAIFNLVIVALGSYYKRWSVIGAGLACALLAGPLTGALAG